jgi:hypothetical protein
MDSDSFASKQQERKSAQQRKAATAEGRVAPGRLVLGVKDPEVGNVPGLALGWLPASDVHLGPPLSVLLASCKQQL